MKTKNLEEKWWWRLGKVIYVGIYLLFLLIVTYSAYVEFDSWQNYKEENNNLSVFEKNNPSALFDARSVYYERYYLPTSLETTLENQYGELPRNLQYHSYVPVDFGEWLGDYLNSEAVTVVIILTILVEISRFVILYVAGIKGTQSIWTKYFNSTNEN